MRPYILIGASMLAGLLLTVPALAAEPAVAKPMAGVRLHKAPSGTLVRTERDKTLAREDLHAGRFADAYHRLRPDVADAQGDTEFLALLAVAALRLGSYGEAMVIYQRLASIEPDCSRWRVGLGLARERLGLEATSVYREALSLSDDGGDLRALLQAKLGQGDLG